MEGGSNTGSNFFIARYADNEAYLGQTYVTRNAGDFVFEASIFPQVDSAKPVGSPRSVGQQSMRELVESTRRTHEKRARLDP